MLQKMLFMISYFYGNWNIFLPLNALLRAGLPQKKKKT